MSILTKPQNVQLKLGTKIKGKWNSKEYTILRLLGSGENGTVFLVESLEKKQYALKLSSSTIDLSYEIQAIQRLSEAQGSALGFYIFDVDDFIFDEVQYSYYVMPFQRGVSIENYLYGKSEKEYLKALNILFP